MVRPRRRFYGWMAPVDVTTDVDELAQTLTDTAAALALVLKAGLAVPAARHDKPAPVDVRRDAYRRFQDAAVRSYTMALYLPEFGVVNQKPIIWGGPWNATGNALNVFADASGLLAELLAAIADVRLVATPGPAEALRPVLHGLMGMYGSLPSGLRKKTRAAKVPAFKEGQAAFSEALPRFTDACRLDLGYARPPREHWWQRNRPKAPKKADT